MRIRGFISALFVAAALFLCVAGSAIAAPALWVVESQTGKLYLFGTVHLLPGGVQWHSAQLDAAIGESQDLYLEIADPSNAAAARTSLLKVGFDRDHPLSTKISKSDIELLNEAAQRYGFGSEAAFEPMRPWLVYMLLSVGPVVHSGYRADNGVDVQVRKEFVAANKPIYGLETFDQQANVLAGMPEADQIALLDTQLKNGGREESLAKLNDLVGAWVSGNQDALATLLQIDKKPQSSFEQKLLTDRNKAWATALAERLKLPGTSFVSVGAAHLVGPNGVPALLAGMGLRVTRVPIPDVAQASPAPSPSEIPPATPAATPATSPSPAASATPIPQTLTPPPGWKGHRDSFASGPFKADMVWVDPNRNELIIAGHLDLPGISANDLDALNTNFHQGLVAGVGPKGVVEASTHVKICGGKQDGTYTKLQVASVNQDVVLAVSDRGYLAQYIRAKNTPDDPAAIKAMLSLCAP